MKFITYKEKSSNYLPVSATSKREKVLDNSDKWIDTGLKIYITARGKLDILYIYLGGVDGAVEQRRNGSPAEADLRLHGEPLERHLHLLRLDSKPTCTSNRHHIDQEAPPCKLSLFQLYLLQY
jgi:hypothetical protein